MMLLAIGGVVLLLGLLGLRSTARSYFLIAAIAVVFSYIAFTR
jgi:hypothetical protein